MATLEEAFKEFGLTSDAKTDTLKSAYRSSARVHHPDNGGDPVEFTRINKLYMQAMAHAATPKRCGPCAGTGKISTQSGRSFEVVKFPCSACNGTGTIKP